MTDPTQPATDEEVESIRREVKAGFYGPISEYPALIARIDAERARADKNRDDLVEAEAARDHEHAEMARQASLAVDWMIDARKAQAALDAERAARERAEASLAKLRTACMSDYYASGHYEQACDERDEWKARAERTEAALAENTQPPLASNLGGYHAVRDAIADAVGHERTWGWSLVVAVRGLATRAERAEEERDEARATASSAEARAAISQEKAGG